MTEREIFLVVIDLPDPTTRSTCLDGLCGGDFALRSRVEALLQSHDSAGSFLGIPAVEAPDPSADQTMTSVEGTRPESDEEPLTFLAPPQRPDSLGRIGHYEVLQVLGRGGFGIVLRAFDDVLQRVVAVKVLAPQMAATSPARKRFLREARSSAQVRHENVVQVYEVVEHPLPYLVMEFIPGETLQQRLDRSGPLDVPEVLRIGRQIAEGLAAAHATDLIHRDIKPGNVLIEGGQQRVKITDFGLARAADDASISQSGLIAGTPMFMAPEQALGHTLDQRADLFSLGSVLYQMVAGRPPFRANGTLAVLKRVAEDKPRPIREIIPETPQWLCVIISKLHAKNPDERYQSAREVADVLADCESQLKANSKLQDFTRIPKGKPSLQGSGWWKRVAAAVVSLSVIALAVTEFAGVTHLIRSQQPAASNKSENPATANQVGTTDIHAPVSSNGKIASDHELLQGKWRLVSADFNGVPLIIDELKVIDWISFSGEDFAFNRTEDGKVTIEKGKFKITPSTSPKQLDLFVDTATPNLMIYEIQGDSLIVGETNDGSRPTSIKLPTTNVLVKRLRRDSTPSGAPSKQPTLAPFLDTDVKRISALPAAKQIEEVRKELMKRNPEFDGMLTPTYEGDAVVGLEFLSNRVQDISPVRALLHLTTLNCRGDASVPERLSDLRPLKGMKLKELTCSVSAVSDLTPLHGMPLTHLHVDNSGITDLSPLESMPLKVLNCSYTQVSNLSPLKQMSLSILWCNHTEIGDLTPLKGMPLEWLTIQGTKVKDITVLKEMPLTQMYIDYDPKRDREVLRSLTTLRTINDKPADDFWKEVDKQAVFAPFPDAEVKRIAALPSAEQIEEVRRELMKRNPDFDGTLLPTRENEVVTGLAFSTDKVADIAPLRALTRLTSLTCESKDGKGRLTDLSPLKNLKLRSFNCTGNLIASLEPLRDMPLTYLVCRGALSLDLTPLKGMKLSVLECGFSGVADLTPLKGMMLTRLMIDHSPLMDLSPLQGMPLTFLHCGGSRMISDLAPLKGMPLTHLYCNDTRVTDLSPLKDMPLKELACDFKPQRDAAVLRSIKTLEIINYKPVAEFWKEVGP